MRKATEDWLTSARDDLETVAEIIDNARLTNVVAFHAQQCVEKCFKAILEEHERDVPNIHNLVTLHGRIETDVEQPIDIDVDMDALDRLNQLYIEARYPGELGLLPEGKPSQDEAAHFQQFAQDLYHYVRRHLDSSA